MESKERPGPHINLKPIYSITYWHMELSTKAKAEMKNHAPFVCKAFFTIKTMLGCCVKTGFQSFVRPNLDQFWQTAKQLNKLRFQGNILACLGIVTDSFFLIVFSLLKSRLLTSFWYEFPVEWRINQRFVLWEVIALIQSYLTLELCVFSIQVKESLFKMVRRKQTTWRVVEIFGDFLGCCDCFSPKSLWTSSQENWGGCQTLTTPLAVILFLPAAQRLSLIVRQVLLRKITFVTIDVKSNFIGTRSLKKSL